MTTPKVFKTGMLVVPLIAFGCGSKLVKLDGSVAEPSVIDMAIENCHVKALIWKLKKRKHDIEAVMNSITSEWMKESAWKRYKEREEETYSRIETCLESEGLEKRSPEINYSELVDVSLEDSEAAGITIVPIEVTVEAQSEDSQDQPYQPPKATFDYTQNSNILDAIRNLSERNNCTPVWDLPNIDLTIYGPWHISASSITNNEDDFIFLCRNNSDNFAFSLILLSKSMQEAWDGCPSKAYAGSTTGYPSGLEIHLSNSSYHSRDLSMWYSENGEPGPAGSIPTGPVIDTGKHDSGVILTCYKGKWYGYHSH